MTFDDDDTEAANAFQNWFNTFQKKTMDSMKADSAKITDETAKAITDRNISAINGAVTKILSKMRGKFDSNDNVSWSITKSDGAVTPFKVDTDF